MNFHPFQSHQEVIPMRDRPKTTAVAFTLLLFLCCLPSIHVSAELTPDERLAEQGLTLLALRNDTIDTDPVSYTHLTLPTKA